jgi:Holliday junction resolvase-like predicted endonuclease
MTLLVSLIGEQPMPTLLPVRYLQPDEVLLVYTQRTQRVAARLQPLLEEKAEVGLLLADPYDLTKLVDALKAHMPAADHGIIFNITGGTKLMAVAAYALAAERRSEVVYLRTEGMRAVGQQELLYRYTFAADGAMQGGKPEHMAAPLITLDDFLRAHFDGYQAQGVDMRVQGADLELAVAAALEGYVDEMIAGVRPAGLKSQIEIDLVVRKGSQVGYIEIKSGGEGSGKKAVDQLTTSAARELSGIYTARFLVTGAARSTAHKPVADRLEVKVVELNDPLKGKRLSTGDAYALRLGVLSELTGDPRLARQAARKK